MTIEVLFLTLGIVFLAIILILQTRMRQLYEDLDRRQRQAERATAFVAAILTAWAEHWGDPPETVKPILLRIVYDPQYASSTPKDDPPQVWVGSDFGLVSILVEVKRRLHAVGSSRL